MVLPLVPVTATTGTRGRSVVGPGPPGDSRTVAAASETSFSTSSDVESAGPPPRSGTATPSSTEATARPSASARVRLRHG